MPIGSHIRRCHKCGREFRCGDCIEFDCPECRRAKLGSVEDARRNTEIREYRFVLAEFLAAHDAYVDEADEMGAGRLRKAADKARAILQRNT